MPRGHRRWTPHPGVGKYGGGAKAVAHIVAISNPSKAVDLVRRDNPADENQDSGRVSAAGSSYPRRVLIP
jgi:hypothetical protein